MIKSSGEVFGMKLGDMIETMDGERGVIVDFYSECYVEVEMQDESKQMCHILEIFKIK